MSVGMSQNQSHHLIKNSALGNYMKGDTGGNDGIFVSENFPLSLGCFASWQHWGSSVKAQPSSPAAALGTRLGQGRVQEAEAWPQH